MPLPKLPTRMGAMISVLDHPEAAPTPAPVKAEAPVAASQPRAKRPAAVKAAAVALVAPAPAPEAPAKTQEPAIATPISRPAKQTRIPAAKRKLFVLDTNVLLHDSNSLFKFQQHDIFLPMIVLEELDHQKKGMSEVARNARQVSRFLDGLVGSSTSLEKGVDLDTLGNQEALGSLAGKRAAPPKPRREELGRRCVQQRRPGLEPHLLLAFDEAGRRWAAHGRDRGSDPAELRRL